MAQYQTVLTTQNRGAALERARTFTRQGKKVRVISRGDLYVVQVLVT